MLAKKTKSLLSYPSGKTAAASPVVVRSLYREKLSRVNLLEILKECDWNKAEVARRVGLSRTAIWKYMKKWDIPLKRPAE